MPRKKSVSMPKEADTRKDSQVVQFLRFRDSATIGEIYQCCRFYPTQGEATIQLLVKQKMIVRCNTGFPHRYRLVAH